MNAEKKEAVSGECLVSTPSNTPLFFVFQCLCDLLCALSLSVCALPSHFHHDKKAIWACAYVYDREAKWKRLKLKWHDFLTMWRLEVALTSHAFFPFHISPFAFMSKCYKFTFPISEMPLVWFTIFSVAYFSQNKQPLCAGVFECAVYAWQWLCVHSKEWCECVPEWFSRWMKPTMRHKEPREWKRHIERPRWEVPWLFFYMQVRSLHWLHTKPCRLWVTMGTSVLVSSVTDWSILFQWFKV